MRIKGLLLKDCYTLVRQMKIFVFLIIIFAITPGSSMMAFAIVYAGMLAISAMSYDERSNWNQFAAMMPYKTSELVISKYLLGYLGVAGAAVLSILSQAVLSLFHRQTGVVETAAILLVSACVALFMQAVNLPVMFKMGVEKGRLFFFVLVFVVIGGSVFLGKFLLNDPNGWLDTMIANYGVVLCMGLVVLTVIANVISIVLSIHFYPQNIREK